MTVTRYRHHTSPEVKDSCVNRGKIKNRAAFESFLSPLRLPFRHPGDFLMAAYFSVSQGHLDSGMTQELGAVTSCLILCIHLNCEQISEDWSKLFYK